MDQYYSAFPGFILRIPSFSFEELGCTLQNQEYLYQRLKEPVVQEAIYLASPDLYKELCKWLNGQMKSEKEQQQLLDSLLRYLSRMSTRCTPFGLFAGCLTGSIGNCTKIVPATGFNRHTRLDMYYLCALYDYITASAQIRKQIKYYPNSSIYRIGKSIRYIEYTYNGYRKKYSLTQIESSIYIKQLLHIATRGATIQEMTTYLAKEGFEEEVATDFINELIDSQIIVGEYHSSITGIDYLEKLIELTEKVPRPFALADALKTIHQKLSGTVPYKQGIELYQDIISGIRQIGVDYEEKFLFQVDMYKESQVATISQAVLEELKQAVGFLNKITVTYADEALKNFTEEFFNRYEYREVPLMEVLDPETGIGYPPGKQTPELSSLIDDLVIPSQTGNANSYINSFHQLLIKKIAAMANNKEKEIVLTDEDVTTYTANWNDLPLTLAVNFEIVADNEHGSLLRIKNCGGSSGANLLSRFAHILPEIEQWVKCMTEKEETLVPDKILAEIVHLPESRVGNILYRPHLRKYEIVYMATSSLPEENQIPVSDLFLSIRNGKLTLRSGKLNKEILPRLTNAHNYHNKPLAVYRFLCDLQHQNSRPALFFDWNPLDLPFYPRVRYRHTILSPAVWKVNREEINFLFREKEANRQKKIAGWRAKREMPRFVLLPDGDNELFVDWENPLSVCALVKVIKQREKIIFQEFLFDPDSAVVKNETGSFVNELIVVFHKN